MKAIIIILSFLFFVLGCSESNNDDTGKENTDSCNNITCNGFGTCNLQDGKATCTCREGYHAENTYCIKDEICEVINCNGFGFGENKSTFEIMENENKTFLINTIGENISFTLENAPIWVTLNNSTGELNINTTRIDPSEYNLDITLNDGVHTEKKSFIIKVFISIENLENINVYKMNKLAFETLGQPITSVSNYSPAYAPNSDGSWDILKVYFKKYWENYESIIYDTASEELKHVIHEGNHRQILTTKNLSAIAPNRKLFISNLSRPNTNINISVYNPDTNSYEEDITTSRFVQGERHPITVGTDGMIYIAGSYKDYEGTDTSRHATALQINPDTRELTEYGKLGPDHSPNGVWGYTVGADSTYVYVASGKIPWYLVAYNKETGEQETILTTTTINSNITVTQYKHGVTANITGNTVGEDGMYWLHNGKAIYEPDVSQNNRFTSCPWNPEGVDPFLKYVDSDFPNQLITDDYAASSGRKENTLWYKPNNIFKKVDYTVNVHPKEIKGMHKMDDGKFLVVGKEYSGYSTFDPNNNSSKFLGKLTGSGSHAVSKVNGKFYISGYPSSVSYEYDPSKPWTQGITVGYTPETKALDFDNQSLNPRFLGYFREKSGTHKPYNSASSKNGVIYFAGKWYRDGKGGGLAWYDPATDSFDGFYDIFSNYQLRYITSVIDGRYMLISGLAVEDTTMNKPTPTIGRLFLLDTEDNTIINTFDPIPESINPGDTVYLGEEHIMGLTSNEKNGEAATEYYIYKMNILTGEILWKRTLKLEIMYRVEGNMDDGYGFKIARDGNIYVLLNRKGLVKITQEGHFEVIGAVSTYGDISIDGSDIYLMNKDSIELYSNIIE